MTEKLSVDFMEAAAAISMEWIDIEPVATALFEQYQKGFEAGKASAPIDPEQLKAEYQRGRDDYHRELIADLTSPKYDRNSKLVIEPKAPIAKSIERVAPPAIKPGRGPKPTDINRPEGIPTNFDMCRLVLIDAGKPLTATEIRDRVRTRWWPNAPDDWKSSPFGFLGSGKLRKNADNKFELGSGSPTAVAKRADPQTIINREAERRQVLPREPVKAPMPPVKPTAGPRPPAEVKFDHNGKSVELRTMREYVIAGKLRAAMGKGHVSEGFIAQEVIGSNTESNRMIVKDLCLGMNEQLAAVGLNIGHYPGFGLLMKEVAP